MHVCRALDLLSRTLDLSSRALEILFDAFALSFEELSIITFISYAGLRYYFIIYCLLLLFHEKVLSNNSLSIRVHMFLFVLVRAYWTRTKSKVNITSSGRLKMHWPTTKNSDWNWIQIVYEIKILWYILWLVDYCHLWASGIKSLLYYE